MRLQYDDLPGELKEKYEPKDIHKVIKKSKTLIQIHTRNKTKDNWRKHAGQWQNGQADCNNE